MNEEEIQELMNYNLEYLEARNSEEIFGGDYTSEVDLKYANKEISKLQQDNKQLKDNWNKLKGYLEHSIDFEKLYSANSLEDVYREIKDKIEELEKSDNNE